MVETRKWHSWVEIKLVLTCDTRIEQADKRGARVNDNFWNESWVWKNSNVLENWSPTLWQFQNCLTQEKCWKWFSWLDTSELIFRIWDWIIIRQKHYDDAWARQDHDNVRRGWAGEDRSHIKDIGYVRPI